MGENEKVAPRRHLYMTKTIYRNKFEASHEKWVCDIRATE